MSKEIRETENVKKAMDGFARSLDLVDRENGVAIVGFMLTRGQPFISICGDPLYAIGLAQLITEEATREINRSAQLHKVPK